jgi:hypothetical protein
MNLFEELEDSDDEADYLVKRIHRLEKAIRQHRNSTSNPTEADRKLWSCIHE